MEKHKVVPDVIDSSPPAPLEVTYSQGIKVDGGNVLTPTKVKDPPLVKWQAEKNAFYALVMTDPDAPSRREPKFREWHHWLVGNIPGDNVSKGEVLTEYVGAGPPKNTGLHRYVLLVGMLWVWTHPSSGSCDNTSAFRSDFLLIKLLR